MLQTTISISSISSSVVNSSLVFIRIYSLLQRTILDFILNNCEEKKYDLLEIIQVDELLPKNTR